MNMHIPCACCSDDRATACVLTCLHGLCGACADDVAGEREPRCPQCGEPVGRHELERTLDTPDAQPAAAADASAAVDWSALHAECMSARDVAQRQATEALNFAYYATHNHRDAMADIAHAYDTPEMGTAPFRARRNAFLAEADSVLRADMKNAELALDAAQALLASAAECLARCEACRPRDAPTCVSADMPLSAPSSAELGHIAARAATLKARAQQSPPPLVSTVYFACVRPLTPLAEPHAFLGRTLLWHAGWDRADHGVARWGRHSTPYAVLAVLPDGRPVVRDDAYSDPGPAWLQPVLLMLAPGRAPTRDRPEPLAKVACAGHEDAVLLPRTLDGHPLQDTQADGAGRVWAHTWRRLVCWAPDGSVLHDVDPRALLLRWGLGDCSDETYSHLAVAPCGVVLLGLDASHVIAATPDLKTVLWRHTGNDVSRGFFAVVLSDTLFAAPTQPARAPLCLDVHTGAPRDPQDFPELAAWDYNRVCQVQHGQGRANALQRVWLPQALAAALPSLAGSAPDRVWQVRDLVQPPPRECSVVGAHGRLYRCCEPDVLTVD